MVTLAKDLENLARNAEVGNAIDDLKNNPEQDEATAKLPGGKSVTIRRIKIED